MLGGTQEWLEYRSTAFGTSHGEWDDGPDFAQLRTRWDADPDLVEAMLVRGIAARDPLAAESLAYLELTPESAAGFCALLGGCLEGAPAGFRLAAARAAGRLAADDCWADEMVRVLHGAGFWADRMAAARALGELTPTGVLIDAVALAIEDPEFLVRRQAAMTLMRFGGRLDATAPDDDVLALIRTESTPEQRSRAGWQLALLATANAPTR
jgi:hypothetical protein